MKSITALIPSLTPIILTTGAPSAITETTTRCPRVTFQERSSGKMISMRTDAGALWVSLTQGHSLRLHGHPATHETGHSYFAQSGHSHFAATVSVNLLTGYAIFATICRLSGRT